VQVRSRTTRLAAALVASVLLFALAVLGAAAAWTDLGWYSPATQTAYSPYQGGKWGGLDYDYAGRYLQAENNNMAFSQDHINWIQGNNDAAALVFHMFKADGNCYIPFNYRDNSYYTWLPSPRLITKGAGCWQEGYEAPGPNELRIYFDPWQMVTDRPYWGGAIFNDVYYQTYGNPYPWADGDAVYDTYYGNNKGYMTKFRFYTWGGVGNP